MLREVELAMKSRTLALYQQNVWHVLFSIYAINALPRDIV